MVTGTRPGIPPKEEQRYREFLARQEALRRSAPSPPKSRRPSPPPPEIIALAARHHRLYRRRLQRARLTAAAGFFVLLCLLGMHAWFARPIILSLAEVQDPQQTTWAQQNGFPLEFTNSIGMVFRIIPPGKVRMGSPPNEPGRRSDETRGEVLIQRPFYIAVTETTVGQYQQMMGTNPSLWAAESSHPVESVLWNEALLFCNRLSQQEKLPQALEHTSLAWICYFERPGYRLPTEAEWEYACRANTTGPLYTGPLLTSLRGGGPNLWRAAWYAANSGGRTHPVAGREPNPWGLYDMLGNVAEWCWDWYSPTPARNPYSFSGPVFGQAHVLKGGGWYSMAARCRAGARRRWPDDLRLSTAGFRCAITATPHLASRLKSTARSPH